MSTMKLNRDKAFYKLSNLIANKAYMTFIISERDFGKNAKKEAINNGNNETNVE